jgi:type II secretory pathway predicted ATPase ExeA
MIRSHFGISKNPFSTESCELLEHQQEVYDILKVHSSQGGLCLVMGIPGTGKSVLKSALQEKAEKNTVVVTISRTMHTYTSIVKILCEAFKVDFSGNSHKCELALLEEAQTLKRQGKSIITIVDDAHLLEIDSLKKLRLLFEDFPRTHNLILVGQPSLLSRINLSVHEDIKSRITYSTILKPLNPDLIEEFIHTELDKVKLGHNIFTEEAIELIVRSSEGLLRRVRNLCISAMLEAVRHRTKSINLEIINQVLRQPHWRKEQDMRTA